MTDLATLKLAVLDMIGDPGEAYWNGIGEVDRAVKHALRLVQEECVPDLFIPLSNGITGYGDGTEIIDLPVGMSKILTFRSMESDALYSYPWTAVLNLADLRRYARRDPVNRLTSTDRRLYCETIGSSVAQTTNKSIITYPILLATDQYELYYIPTLSTTGTIDLPVILEIPVIQLASSVLLLKGGKDIELSRVLKREYAEAIQSINQKRRFTTGIDGPVVTHG